jgi:hypothetical protein
LKNDSGLGGTAGAGKAADVRRRTAATESIDANGETEKTEERNQHRNGQVNGLERQL